jgi:hypothetical protein
MAVGYCRILKSRIFGFWILSNGMKSVHVCPSMRFPTSVFGFLRFFFRSNGLGLIIHSVL